MKKRIFSFLAVGLFAITLVGCGSSEDDINTKQLFEVKDTVGSITYEQNGEKIDVYYVNSENPKEKFNIADVAKNFTVRESPGKVTSFKIFEDLLCYPNKETSLGKYYWRAVKLDDCNGGEIVAVNKDLIEANETLINKFGIADITKLVVGGYYDFSLKFDMNANGGKNFGEVPSEFEPS